MWGDRINPLCAVSRRAKRAELRMALHHPPPHHPALDPQGRFESGRQSGRRPVARLAAPQVRPQGEPPMGWRRGNLPKGAPAQRAVRALGCLQSRHPGGARSPCGATESTRCVAYPPPLPPYARAFLMPRKVPTAPRKGTCTAGGKAPWTPAQAGARRAKRREAALSQNTRSAHASARREQPRHAPEEAVFSRHPSPFPPITPAPCQPHAERVQAINTNDDIERQ